MKHLEVLYFLATYFLSVCVFTGRSSAGCCSEAVGGSDRESFSRDTGHSSLQNTHTRINVTFIMLLVVKPTWETSRGKQAQNSYAHGHSCRMHHF